MRLLYHFTGALFLHLVISQDVKQCQAIEGDHWIESRDIVFDQKIIDFCRQKKNSVEYNKRKPNALRLEIEQLGPSQPTEKPQPSRLEGCVRRFRLQLVDGCNGNDPVNNPRNYKYGGALITPEGLRLTLTPLAQQINTVTCWVTAWALYNEFEIFGRSVPWATVGADGQGLLDNLNACGAVHKWQLKDTPHAAHHWRAWGRLPHGSKSCINNAVAAVGGNGTCNGSGSGRWRCGEQK